MQVVDRAGQKVERIWAPVTDTATTGDVFRVGQLVMQNAAGGGISVAGTAGVAAGAGDTTGKSSLVGIIEGVDLRTPTFDQTNRGHEVDGLATNDLQAVTVARVTGYSSDMGEKPKGDTSPYVKVALITPWTKVKVPLRNAARSTAPTLLTVTTASAAGQTVTSTTSADVAGVADMSLAYCRTGANAGIMRVTDDSSATVASCDIRFPFDIAVGDTFLHIPGRVFGESRMQTDAECIYFDVSQTPATDYWVFHALAWELDVAGEEAVIGTFGSMHFDVLRA